MNASTIPISRAPQAPPPVSSPPPASGRDVDLPTAVKVLDSLVSQAREVAWTYDAGSNVNGRVVGPDGTVYLGTDDGTLHAVRPDGSLAWRRDLGGKISGGLAVGPDVTIYAGTEQGCLQALDAQGHAKWAVQLSRIEASPYIGDGGVVYAGDSEGLHAVSADGHEMWVAKTNDPITTTPVMTPEGRLVAADMRSRVYGIEPATGRVAWMKQLSAAVLAGAPVRGMDGRVWVTCLSRDMRNDEMVGLDPRTGAPSGLVPLRDTIHLHAAPDDNGLVYLACNDGGSGGSLRALSSWGRVDWQARTQIPLETTPCRTIDGAVVARDARGVVHAYDAKGGTPLWSQDVTRANAPYRHRIGEIVQGPDGTLYADDRATCLVALRPPRTLEERLRQEQDRVGSEGRKPPGIKVEDGWIVVGGVRVPVRQSPGNE